MPSAGDQQTVFANPGLFWKNRLQWRQHGNLDLQLGDFLFTQLGETRVSKTGRDGSILHGEIKRIVGMDLADAAAQHAADPQSYEDSRMPQQCRVFSPVWCDLAFAAVHPDGFQAEPEQFGFLFSGQL